VASKKSIIDNEVFIKESDVSLITEDKNNTPIYERDIRTYKIAKNKNNFKIYEIFRKSKPKQILTIKANKGMSKEQIIKDIQSNKIHINTKYSNKTKYSNHTLNVIQTNYNARLSRPQLVGLVKVQDSKRGLIAFLVGYSTKMPTNYDLHDLNKAKLECEDMALQKFIRIYGEPQGEKDKFDLNDSGKAKDLRQLPQMSTELIQFRYQYFKTSRK